MLAINKFQDKDSEEICCMTPHLWEENGYRVCLNCGTVLEQVFENTPRRAFTFEEIYNRKNDEPVFCPIGPRTVIRGNTDSKGSLLAPSDQMKYTRLSKIQRSLTTSYERNLWIALPNFQKLQEKLSIPDIIIKDALRIYQTAVKDRLTMGRSIDILLAASIFVSFKIHGVPRVLDELLKSLDLPKKSVIKCYRLLLIKITPKMKIRVMHLNPMQYIDKFGEELKLTMKVRQDAIKILHKAKGNGLLMEGKDPKGLAAAAIYIASHLNNEHRTQSEIARQSHVTEVTLRVRSRDINQYCRI